MSRIQPTEIRYIKLGEGGGWAQRSISEGILLFGYPTVPHDACERRDWQEIEQRLSDRRSARAITAGVNEIRAFYELGEDCLWITFVAGHLYWAFADPAVQWIGDGNSDNPSRKRVTLSGWRKTDISGKSLKAANLSSKLTKVQGFRGTICRIAEEQYLLRRINGDVEPIVARANEARRAVTLLTLEMIHGLDWADFETLADLIFARSGWQRFSRVGENIPTTTF